MITRNGLIENGLLVGMLASCGITLYGIVMNSSAFSSIGTAGVAGSIGLWRENSRNDDHKKRAERLREIESELNEATRKIQGQESNLERAQTALNGFRDASGHLLDVSVLIRENEALRSDLERAKQINRDFREVQSNLERLQLTHGQTSEELGRSKALSESEKATWAKRFDDMMNDYDSRIEALQKQLSDQNLELYRYRDSNAQIIEVEKMRVITQVTEMQVKLNEIQAYAQGLHSQLNKGIEVIRELEGDFQAINEVDMPVIAQTHEAQLSARDQELLRLSGLVNALMQPQLFNDVGEFARAANKLITVLWEGSVSVFVDDKGNNIPVCLDASEIVSYADRTGFDVYLSQRDRKSRGKAFIDQLNDGGNVLAIQCACIKDLKFEYDPENPHRIKTSMIFRKAPRTKSSVASLWKSADQFAGIAGKWSRVRITGGSESGKSPVAEMIAGAIQQNRPTAQIQLAFPKQNSKKNNWGIPITYSGWEGCLQAANDASQLMEARDNGKVDSSFFYAPIIDEVDTTLTKYKEVAEAIKAVLKSGSHNDVGIIILGQNANVRQWTNFDRSDFENCVNVHIGSNAKHAIENSSMGAKEKEQLKDTAAKLSAFCEAENDGIEAEDMKVRFAFVTEPGKAPYFVELPRFGAITYNNLLASQAISNPVIAQKQEVKTPTCACGEKMKRNNSKGLWVCGNKAHNLLTHGKKSRPISED